jgi:hypothetical protein
VDVFAPPRRVLLEALSAGAQKPNGGVLDSG